MEHTNLPIADRVSALADGQLTGEAFASAVLVICGNEVALKDWNAYHLVGDVLRNEGGAVLPDGLDFLRKFEQRLQQEPSDLRYLMESEPFATELLPEKHVVSSAVQNAPGANAQVFRWKLLAGVACMGLAGVVGLGTWSQSVNMNADQPSVARGVRSDAVPLATTSDVETAVMLRDPVLDGLMAEHQRLGGYSALQIPTGFLRNATYRAPTR